MLSQDAGGVYTDNEVAENGSGALELLPSSTLDPALDLDLAVLQRDNGLRG